MAALAMVCRAGSWCALMAVRRGVVRSAPGVRGQRRRSRSCTPSRRSRSVSTPPRRARLVKSRRLLEPFAALKSAGAQRKAEALSAKLCRTGDDFIYEITLLHRDGRLVHVEMEAGTGKIASRPAREPHETHEPHEPRESHEAHEPPAKN